MPRESELAVYQFECVALTYSTVDWEEKWGEIHDVSRTQKHGFTAFESKFAS